MGLRLETYNDNFVGLIVDFTFIDNSDYFCNTDSIEEAIKYFDLYYDEKTARLKRNDPNQKIVDKLAINISNIKEFQKMLEQVTAEMTDEQIVHFVLLVPDWEPNREYLEGTRVRYQDILYKCIEEHTSILDEPPISSPHWHQMIENMPIEPREEAENPENIINSILSEE